MKLILPALDEAGHAGTRKVPAIAAALVLLGLILLLIYLEVLPLPKARMTVAFAAYAGMIVLTTWTYHRQGFHANAYRALVLLETLVLLSGFAFAMAANPPGLPILWAFYLLLAVLTAQDVGPSRLGLAVVLLPVSALFVYEFLSNAAFDLRQYSYTISCYLLSAALFLFFGKNKQSQLALAARQVETELALNAARSSLEGEKRLRALDEDWLTILSKAATALVLVDEHFDALEIRHGGSTALRMKNDTVTGILVLLRSHFEAALRAPEPVAQFGVPLPGAAGHVDLRIVALPTGTRAERFAVLIQDATARIAVEAENRRLMEQMVIADKLGSMGMLAAGVAHEVNNPLSYVMGNVEHLLQSGQFETKVAAALADVDTGLKEIASIIADLRSFSYSSAFSYRQTVDLRDIILRAQRLVAAEIKQNADLQIEVPPEPIYVRCQPERIQQVIVNLLMNASQALLGRPWSENRILLALGLHEGSAELSVRDNGMGMSAETREKIFDLFFTTKPAGKGTGLGLSIAYRIAEDHHGGLSVDSQLGQGSNFTLRLPIVTTPGGDELRVLIVDDEERTLAFFSRSLERFHVTTANSIAAAQSLLGNNYDVVLCDVRLGDGLGFRLYELAPETLRKRFVFYSALPPNAADLQGRPDGVPILLKPVSLERVEQALLQAARSAVGA